MGKQKAIVLAKELDAGLILVDERKARAIAQRLGLQVIGTGGILLLLKEQGKIAKVRPLLDKLRSLSFRLSDRVYKQIILQANE